MTNACRTAAICRPWRLAPWVCACALALLAVPALAQDTVKPAPVRPASKPPQTRSVLIVNPTPGQRFNRQMRQQKLQSDLRRSTIQQQLRQKTADTARVPFADHPGLQRQTDITDRARDANARMRQQSLLDQYRDLPQPAPAVSSRPSKQPPASARSGG